MTTAAAWSIPGGRGTRSWLTPLHLLHCLLEGPVDVLRIDAELLRGCLLGAGDRILNRPLDLGLADDKQPGLTRFDKVAHFLGAVARHPFAEVPTHSADHAASRGRPED